MGAKFKSGKYFSEQDVFDVEFLKIPASRIEVGGTDQTNVATADSRGDVGLVRARGRRTNGVGGPGFQHCGGRGAGVQTFRPRRALKLDALANFPRD